MAERANRIMRWAPNRPGWWHELHRYAKPDNDYAYNAHERTVDPVDLAHRPDTFPLDWREQQGGSGTTWRNAWWRNA